MTNAAALHDETVKSLGDTLRPYIVGEPTAEAIAAAIVTYRETSARMHARWAQDPKGFAQLFAGTYDEFREAS